MPVPSVVTTTLTPVGPIGAGLPSATVASFRMEDQFNQNWCWAAVSVSVRRSYDATTPLTQCSTANMTLNRTDCCTIPTPDTCNVPASLGNALSVTKSLGSSGPGVLPFDMLGNDIAAQRCVCYRIAWLGGGAHFVVVYGAARKVVSGSIVDWVFVDDPWPYQGPSDMSYLEFVRGYRCTSSIGSVTHSYRTHP